MKLSSVIRYVNDMDRAVVDAFYDAAARDGLEFTSEPIETFGRRIGRFLDSDGAECSVSGK